LASQDSWQLKAALRYGGYPGRRWPQRWSARFRLGIR